MNLLLSSEGKGPSLNFLKRFKVFFIVLLSFFLFQSSNSRATGLDVAKSIESSEALLQFKRVESSESRFGETLTDSPKKPEASPNYRYNYQKKLTREDSLEYLNFWGIELEDNNSGTISRPTLDFDDLYEIDPERSKNLNYKSDTQLELKKGLIFRALDALKSLWWGLSESVRRLFRKGQKKIDKLPSSEKQRDLSGELEKWDQVTLSNPKRKLAENNQKFEGDSNDGYSLGPEHEAHKTKNEEFQPEISGENTVERELSSNKGNSQGVHTTMPKVKTKSKEELAVEIKDFESEMQKLCKSMKQDKNISWDMFFAFMNLGFQILRTDPTKLDNLLRQISKDIGFASSAERIMGLVKSSIDSLASANNISLAELGAHCRPYNSWYEMILALPESKENYYIPFMTSVYELIKKADRAFWGLRKKQTRVALSKHTRILEAQKV